MKDAQSVAAKFAQRGAAASSEYVEGAKNTDKDWQQRTVAAGQNYRTAVTEAASRGAFEKGVAAAGTQAWREGVTEKGGARFASGITAGATKYATNSAKFDGARKAAAGLPRSVKGSPQNMQRVQAVVSALRKQKTGV